MSKLTFSATTAHNTLHYILLRVSALVGAIFQQSVIWLFVLEATTGCKTLSKRVGKYAVFSMKYYFPLKQEIHWKWRRRAPKRVGEYAKCYVQ